MVWSLLKLWRINEKTFNLRVKNKQFVGTSTGSDNNLVVAVSNTSGVSETFVIERKKDEPNRVRIRASNGFYFRVRSEDQLVSADYGRKSGWRDDDPSVFEMNVTTTLHGEFQVTNGYGPHKAPQFMKVSKLSNNTNDARLYVTHM